MGKKTFGNGYSKVNRRYDNSLEFSLSNDLYWKERVEHKNLPLSGPNQTVSPEEIPPEYIIPPTIGPFQISSISNSNGRLSPPQYNDKKDESF